jgi:hypothetical protein
VLSFPYALRFLFATRPAVMGRVLGIVYRTLATHQIRKAGHTHESARTGAVTLIQRFGSALNLNIHFHMLLLDGVYTDGHAVQAKPHFQRVKAPDRAELEQLVYAISERTGRYLERQGLLVRDQDNSYLALELDDTGLEGVLGSSITYRIAVGPQQGRKAFCLQSLPLAGRLEESNARVAKVAGFSLHAGLTAGSRVDSPSGFTRNTWVMLPIRQVERPPCEPPSPSLPCSHCSPSAVAPHTRAAPAGGAAPPSPPAGTGSAAPPGTPPPNRAPGSPPSAR